MPDQIRSEHIIIGGMTCAGCRTRIENALRNTPGVRSAKVNCSGGFADVSYDASAVSVSEIRASIERLDYKVLSQGSLPGKKDSGSKVKTCRVFGLIIIIAALYFLITRLKLSDSLPLAEAGMGYGMLLLIGLLTSVHCIAMCGGINLTQCIPQSGGSPLRASALYNIGRVISYTVVGFIVGALGSVITLGGVLKGAVQIIAGMFMVIMGVNMLGIFPWLYKLTPRMPSFIASRVNAEKGKSKSPLIIGLLNGLMPCGPLQAMQIYALSTGSPIKGAVSMLLFSIGTVPLMFGLGALSSLLTKKFTHKVVTVGAVFVTVLGLTMLSQGAALSGLFFGSLLPQTQSAADGSAAENEIVDGVQIVASVLSSGSYPKITVQQGIPVKWTIDAPQGSINGCNNRIYIPEYGIEYAFKQGVNVIEFTPDETGRFQYNCWMGMIRGIITVVPQRTEVNAYPEATATTQSKNSIFVESLAAAKIISQDSGGADYEYQTVTITLTDEGFSPAVAVVQNGIETEWIIDNQTSDPFKAALRVPLYNTEVPLIDGKNLLVFSPSENFQFGNGDDPAFGYVKVADDIGNLNEKEIKSEVTAFTPIIYPAEQYEQSGGASCH